MIYSSSAQSCWPATDSAPNARPTPRSRRTLRMPVVSLELVDPRFYHLDTALAVLDDTTHRLLPAGVQRRGTHEAARAVPRRHRGGRAPTPTCSASTRCPTACNVVLPAAATGFAEQLRDGRIPADRCRPVRTAQGRRIRQMLHAGGTSVTILD